MKLTALKILTHSGHGTRKDCAKLIKKGQLSILGEKISDPKKVFETDELEYELLGTSYIFQEHVYLAMDKPSGFECSHNPEHNESIFSLLEQRYLNREVRAVGRLDVDTTGLILFTDDGKFNQKLMSPKSKVSKSYEVELKHTVDSTFIETLSNGVKLKDEPDLLVKPELVEKLGDTTVLMKISEGKYHQVKRMVAAASNRVVGLRRVAIGDLNISDLKLEEDKTYVLSSEDLGKLTKEN